MKIFSADQIYKGDAFTIEKQNISSTDLMERVGIQIFNWLHARLQGAQPKIHVFCGIGNNGGDGLVVARHLVQHGYNVATHVVNFSDKRSKDFLVNFDRIKNTKHWPELINSPDTLPVIAKEDIVIDAIFGIGLNRKPADWVANVIAHINAHAGFVLSVDIPSGLPVTSAVGFSSEIIKATHTLTFQSPKLAFFLKDTAGYTRQWEILDIGIDPEFLYTEPTQVHLMTKQDVLPMYIPREKFSHKGTYGHSLIVGGSYGKMGAAMLSAESCLNAGAGLVTAYIPKCGYIPMQTALPEVMVQTDVAEDKISDINHSITPNAIAIGPGLGTDTVTIQAFTAFLDTLDTPVVIDADAINILSKHPELLKKVPAQSILTPHTKELERLIGTWESEYQKIEKAIAFALEYDIILHVKEAYSMSVYAGKVYINSTGNPGMATAGSGDVLTGIITGLVSQGYSPLHAAIFGAYLHGSAGDIAVSQMGYEALIASELIDYISDAYVALFKKPEQQQQQQQTKQ